MENLYARRDGSYFGQFGFRTKIINGDFRVNKRAAGAKVEPVGV
jgi:hypothetical protein